MAGIRPWPAEGQHAREALRDRLASV